MPSTVSLGDARAKAEQQRLFSKGAAEVPVSDLLPSPENGRKRLRSVQELADSYEDDGVVQALTVVTAAAYTKHYPQHHEYVEAAGTPFVVLHGHRRLAAAKLRGLEKVPVFIRKTVAENGSLRIAAMKENEFRLGLDPIEQGADYQAALDELGISQRELAKRLPRASQTSISHKIKLLRLIEPLQNAVVDHWCKARGIDFEYGGELLLPVKEAATVLASLRPDLQQAYVDGDLSFEAAETIVKSKVALEDQQLPSQEKEEPKAETQAGGGQPTADTTGGGEQQSADTGSGGGGAEDNGSESGGKLPEQRTPDTQVTEKPEEQRPETKPSPSAETAAPETARGTGSAETSTGGTENENRPETQPSTTVDTLTDRGVIPVTTVEAIYEGLKERLSPDEFEQLQDLFLSD
ncbi:ParB N-terminal domain-containing protein [Streptomyces scabiei]|uniref:ParB/RepB/Spo0J family partition protein n=1 Tax=Streptomyces scabiei TaxID=1930 RepID=UPI0029AB1549|nr:ParB N-terminal domain-containing protein [Streptomyces scabiei]MDX3165967.1 ParB N-terminal domain-containing protein [Streptomyces scabiei]